MKTSKKNYVFVTAWQRSQPPVFVFGRESGWAEGEALHSGNWKASMCALLAEVAGRETGSRLMRSRHPIWLVREISDFLWLVLSWKHIQEIREVGTYWPKFIPLGWLLQRMWFSFLGWFTTETVDHSSSFDMSHNHCPFIYSVSQSLYI